MKENLFSPTQPIDHSGQMRRSVILLYALAAILQAMGSAGSAMLAPFFMKERGYSIALVGIPLVINGLGRLTSDLLSGFLATYVSSGVLLVSALSCGLGATILGLVFTDTMPLFFSVWAVLGLTEAMFALALRKIVFDRSPAGQQGRSQGAVAGALGIGFALGPALAGWVGNRWGAGALFILYALPQALALGIFLFVGSHKVARPAVERNRAAWQEGRQLLSRPPFLAACLGIFQAFLFLIGVTRVGFPFLAVSGRGLTLDVVGTMVACSRLTDTAGRFLGGWLSDRFSARSVILCSVIITVPMLVLQPNGTGFITLVLPLSMMTLGCGFTNVAGITFALQTAGDPAKGIALGLARASNSMGSILGPLVAGVLIQRFDYEGGFFSMALISLAISLMVWYGFRRN